MFQILTGLFLLAPIVNVVCGAFFFGGIFAAIAFEISAAEPRFPFLLVFGLSLGFGVFALRYHMVLVFLVRD